jgi:GntR family transcriptional repressor for pyruvate dehydrogenase complex
MTDNRKLYRRIADSIAEDINSGRYRPGDRLPTERELAVHYGVSRPSLREAMIALEIMGLIEAKHGLGITVSHRKATLPPMTDSEIGAFELIEARRLVEAEVAALAATLITDEQIGDLENLIAIMEDADQVKAEQADREFHILIARATGNGALVTSIANLWDWRYESPLARNILARAANLGMTDRIDEHGDILNALKSRSATAARQAMHDHMDRVIEHLLRATELVAVEKAQEASSEQRKALASRFKTTGS